MRPANPGVTPFLTGRLPVLSPRLLSPAAGNPHGQQQISVRILTATRSPHAPHRQLAVVLDADRDVDPARVLTELAQPTPPALPAGRRSASARAVAHGAAHAGLEGHCLHGPLPGLIAGQGHACLDQPRLPVAGGPGVQNAGTDEDGGAAGHTDACTQPFSGIRDIGQQERGAEDEGEESQNDGQVTCAARPVVHDRPSSHRQQTVARMGRSVAVFQFPCLQRDTPNVCSRT